MLIFDELETKLDSHFFHSPELPTPPLNLIFKGSTQKITQTTFSAINYVDSLASLARVSESSMQSEVSLLNFLLAASVFTLLKLILDTEHLQLKTKRTNVHQIVQK